MRKPYAIQLLIALLFITSGGLLAQQNVPTGAEQSPFLGKPNQFVTEKALWDVQFDHDLTTPSGFLGHAACLYINGKYLTSRWATDTLVTYTTTGLVDSVFTVPGLTGTRSLTTDGTYIYAGVNTSTIYRLDATTYQLAPPHISTSLSYSPRFVSYDATLNSGAGGLWTGNFNTDIQAISLTGSVLSTIAAATHTFTGMYGAAVDNFTPGGPYLWVHYQGGANNDQIGQLTLPSGSPTGVTRDVYLDFSGTYGLSTSLAGGIFVSDQVVPSEVTIGALLQGSPLNVLVGYKAEQVGAGLSENGDLEFNIYPNPTSDFINITGDLNESATYTVMNLTGQKILTGNMNSNNAMIDISTLPVGGYIVQVITKDNAVGSKIIVKK